MEGLTLNELKEDLKDLFERGKADYNSSLDAATRCFYEFEPIMKDGVTENIVCSLIIGQLLQEAGNRIFLGQYDLVKGAVDMALQPETELDLTDEEKSEVIELAKKLNEALPKMKIEYDPEAK